MSPIIHRRRAREYLARAVEARGCSGKLTLLRLAVSNTVRAQNLEGASEGEASAEKGVKFRWLLPRIRILHHFSPHSSSMLDHRHTALHWELEKHGSYCRCRG
jgi:hypothetical protein